MLATDGPPLLSAFLSTVKGAVHGAVAVRVIGFVPQNVALSSLHPASGPGCDLLLSLDVTMALLPGKGTEVSKLTLPDNPALDCGVLHQQVWSAPVAFE